MKWTPECSGVFQGLQVHLGLHFVAPNERHTSTVALTETTNAAGKAEGDIHTVLQARAQAAQHCFTAGHQHPSQRLASTMVEK